LALIFDEGTMTDIFKPTLNIPSPYASPGELTRKEAHKLAIAQKEQYEARLKAAHMVAPAPTASERASAKELTRKDIEKGLAQSGAQEPIIKLSSSNFTSQQKLAARLGMPIAMAESAKTPGGYKQYKERLVVINKTLKEKGFKEFPIIGESSWNNYGSVQKAELLNFTAILLRKRDPMTGKVDLGPTEVRRSQEIIDMGKVADVAYPHVPGENKYWLSHNIINKDATVNVAESSSAIKYLKRASGVHQAKLSGIGEGNMRMFLSMSGFPAPPGIGWGDPSIGSAEYSYGRIIPIREGESPVMAKPGTVYPAGVPFRYSPQDPFIKEQYKITVAGQPTDKFGSVIDVNDKGYPIAVYPEIHSTDAIAIKTPAEKLVISKSVGLLEKTGYHIAGPAKNIVGIAERIINQKLRTLTGKERENFVRELYGHESMPEGTTFNTMGRRGIDYVARHLGEYIKTQDFTFPLHDSARGFVKDAIIKEDTRLYKGIPGTHLVTVRATGFNISTSGDVKVAWPPKGPTRIPIEELAAIKRLNPNLAENIAKSGRINTRVWQDLAQSHLGSTIPGDGPKNFIDLSDPENAKKRDRLGLIVEGAKALTKGPNPNSVAAKQLLSREIIMQLSHNKEFKDTNIAYVIDGNVTVMAKPSTYKRLISPGGRVEGFNSDQERELTRLGNAVGNAYMMLGDRTTPDRNVSQYLVSVANITKGMMESPDIAKQITATIPGRRIAYSNTMFGSLSVPSTFAYDPNIAAGKIAYIAHAPYTMSATYNSGRGTKENGGYNPGAGLVMASREDVMALGLDPDRPHVGWAIATALGADFDADQAQFIIDKAAGRASYNFRLKQFQDKKGRVLGDDKFWIPQAEERVKLGAGNPFNESMKKLSRKEAIAEAYNALTVGIKPYTREQIAEAHNAGHELVQQIGPTYKLTEAIKWGIDPEKNPRESAVADKLHAAMYSETQRPSELDPALKGIRSLMRSGGEKGWSMEANSEFLGSPGYSSIYSAASSLMVSLLQEKLASGFDSKGKKVSKFTADEVGILMGLQGDEESQSRVAKLFQRAANDSDLARGIMNLKGDYVKEIGSGDFWKTTAGAVLGGLAFTGVEKFTRKDIERKELEKTGTGPNAIPYVVSDEAATLLEMGYKRKFFEGFPEAFKAAGIMSEHQKNMLLMTSRNSPFMDMVKATRAEPDGSRFFPKPISRLRKFFGGGLVPAEEIILAGDGITETATGLRTGDTFEIPGSKSGIAIKSNEPLRITRGSKRELLYKEIEKLVKGAAGYTSASGVRINPNDPFERKRLFGNLVGKGIEYALKKFPGKEAPWRNKEELRAIGINTVGDEGGAAYFEKMRVNDPTANFGTLVHKYAEDFTNKAALPGILTELIMKDPLDFGKGDSYGGKVDRYDKNRNLITDYKFGETIIGKEQASSYHLGFNNAKIQTLQQPRFIDGVDIRDEAQLGKLKLDSSGNPIIGKDGKPERTPLSSSELELRARQTAAEMFAAGNKNVYNFLMSDKALGVDASYPEFVRNQIETLPAAISFKQKFFSKEQLGEAQRQTKEVQISMISEASAAALQALERGYLVGPNESYSKVIDREYESSTTAKIVEEEKQSVSNPAYNMVGLRKELAGIWGEGAVAKLGDESVIKQAGIDIPGALIDYATTPTIKPKRERTPRANSTKTVGVTPAPAIPTLAPGSSGGGSQTPNGPAAPNPGTSAPRRFRRNSGPNTGVPGYDKSVMPYRSSFPMSMPEWKRGYNAKQELDTWEQKYGAAIKNGTFVMDDTAVKDLKSALSSAKIFENTWGRKGVPSSLASQKQMVTDSIESFQGTVSTLEDIKTQAVQAGYSGFAGTMQHPINSFSPQLAQMQAGNLGIQIPGAGPETRKFGRLAESFDAARMKQPRVDAMTASTNAGLAQFNKSLDEFNGVFNSGDLKKAGKYLQEMGRGLEPLQEHAKVVRDTNTSLRSTMASIDATESKMKGKKTDPTSERGYWTSVREAVSKQLMENEKVLQDIGQAVEKGSAAGGKFVGDGGKTRGGGMDADNLFGTGLSWWMAGAVAGQGEQFMKTIGQEMSKYELRKMQGLYAAGVYGTGGEAVSAMTAGPFGQYRQAMAQEEMANLKFGRAAYTGMAGGIRSAATGIKGAMASMPVVGGMVPLIAEFATQAAPLAMDALIIQQLFKDKPAMGMIVGAATKLKSFIGGVATTTPTVAAGAGQTATTAVAGKGLLGALTSATGLFLGKTLGIAAAASVGADIIGGKQWGSTGADLIGAGGGLAGFFGAKFSRKTQEEALYAQEQGRNAGQRNVQGLLGIPLTPKIASKYSTPEERYTAELENFYNKNAALFPTQGAEGGIQQAQMITTALRRGAGFTPGKQKEMIFSPEEQHLIAQTASQALVSGFAQPEVYTELVDSIRRAMAPATSQQKWADTFGEAIQGTIASDPYNLQQMGMLSQSLGFYGKVATGGKGIQPETATSFLQSTIAKGETGQNFIRALWGAGPEMIQQTAFMLAGREDLGAYNVQTGYTKQQESQLATSREQLLENQRQAVARFGPGVLSKYNQLPVAQPVGTAANKIAMRESNKALIDYGPNTETLSLGSIPGEIFRPPEPTGLEPYSPSKGLLAAVKAIVQPQIQSRNGSAGLPQDPMFLADKNINNLLETAALASQTPQGNQPSISYGASGALRAKSEKESTEYENARQVAIAKARKDAEGTDPAISPEGLRLAKEDEDAAAAFNLRSGAVVQQGEAFKYQMDSMKAQNDNRITQAGWQRDDFALQQTNFNKRKVLINEEYKLTEGLFQKRRQWQLAEFDLQAQNLGKSQGRNQIQYQWQMEDISRNQSQSNIQAGWSMSDLNDDIRFATGRQRRKMITQRQRMSTQQGWQNEEFAIQRERAGIQQGWGQEDFKSATDALARQRDQAQQVYDVENRLQQLQREGTLSDLAYQEKQMSDSRSRFETQQGWEDARFTLETNHAAARNQFTLDEIAEADRHEGVVQELQGKSQTAFETEMGRAALLAKFIIDQIYDNMNKQMAATKITPRVIDSAIANIAIDWNERGLADLMLPPERGYG
jgi:hypothetical protein